MGERPTSARSTAEAVEETCAGPESLRKVIGRKASLNVESIARTEIEAHRDGADERPISAKPTAGAAEVTSARPTGSLKDAFLSFADGRLDMDQKAFVKLCKDCELVDKKFTATDADLIFAKVVTKGQRRINYEQFCSGLENVAAKKDKSPDAIRNCIIRAGGPVLLGTVANAVRFHDDKSTYTGVHVNGGPESVGKGHGTSTQLASRGMTHG